MKVVLFSQLLLILSVGFSNGGEIITSPPITDWGVWGAFEHCPNNTVAQAFQLKTEPHQGALIDDTAGNGVRLFCGDPADPNTLNITSSEGEFGDWGEIYSCPPGAFIYGFELRVEQNGIDDETATNNLAFYCSNNSTHAIQGDGLTFGQWRDYRKCGPTEALCGLQTQVQPGDGPLVDDTSLNNIAAECCEQPVKTHKTP